MTRKINQSVILQRHRWTTRVTLMILGVDRDRIKIGIAGPQEVSILREELIADSREAGPRRSLDGPQSLHRRL